MLGMTKAPVVICPMGQCRTSLLLWGWGLCSHGAYEPHNGGMDPVHGLGSFTSTLVFLASPASRFPISWPGKQGGDMETGTAKLLFG